MKSFKETFYIINLVLYKVIKTKGKKKKKMGIGAFFNLRDNQAIEKNVDKINVCR